MQVAKVVIASVLILTVCAGVLEGKECLLKCVSDMKFLQMSYTKVRHDKCCACALCVT